MQTTVTAVAGDKVSFYWKVSSESNDYLKFYIDGQCQDLISGEKEWEKKSYSLSAGSRTLKWEYIKDGSGYSGEDRGWVDGLVVGTDILYPTPDDYSEMLDSHLKFIESGEGSWFTSWGSGDEYYYDGDAMVSDDTDDGDEARLQAIVESDSSETIKFHWKVSCQTNYDYLRFYIDGTLQHSITGEQDWQQKSYTLSAGIHTLTWVYDDGNGSSGENCGWVDFVQWSGPSPELDPSEWQEIEYKHDLYGRRSEKKVDGFSTRYVYDGPQVIAEYDGNNNLLRKYIYGPGIDQPVCMIEQAESETYYYHYDGLGSVVALSDSAGDTVQTYEYSVFGQPAVEDIDHPNPYMFAGRRYDIEIGLYYNRNRYYNPYTGRFLQADPIGYEDSMNLYTYCRNNPLSLTDPYGLDPDPDPDPNNIQYGELQIATGRYWVLPASVDIDLVLSSSTLYYFFGTGIVDTGTPGNTPSVDAVDAQLANYQALLKTAPVTVLALLGLHKVPLINLNVGWRVYIEVRNWRDKDGGEFSNPYWIEIQGFGTGSGTDYDRTAWNDFPLYETATHAADAGGTAIGLAWALGVFPGVLPNPVDVAGYVITDYYIGDPYNRFSWHKCPLIGMPQF